MGGGLRSEGGRFWVVVGAEPYVLDAVFGVPCAGLPSACAGAAPLGCGSDGLATRAPTLQLVQRLWPCDTHTKLTTATGHGESGRLRQGTPCPSGGRSPRGPKI